jgi:hypothetical protein
LKLALLLPGFIRNVGNFSKINEFLAGNGEYDLDIFCNTYDVVGIETKEPADRSLYLGTEKTDSMLIERELHPKGLNIVSYTGTWEHIDTYFQSRIFEVQKSAPGYWEEQYRKTGSREDENFTLKRIYAQWHMLYGCWRLLEGSGTQYDCVIRSRFDYDTTGVELSPYLESIKPRTLYGTRRTQLLQVSMDNGTYMDVDNDCFCFGTYETMRMYCRLGEPETFHRVISDRGFDSNRFFVDRGKSIKLSSESAVSYWCHVCNGLGFEPLLPEHEAGLRVMRRHKHYASYIADPEHSKGM